MIPRNVREQPMHSAFPTQSDLARALAAGSRDRLLPGAANPALLSRHPAALDNVESAARAALAEPPPALPWSAFRLFHDSGDRRSYEAPYFARRVQMARLAVCILAGRDADGALLAALEDVLWSICDEYSWSVPAHLPRERPAAPGVRDARRFLDLFSSETAFMLAETLHVLGGRIDPRVVARVRSEVRERVLDSYLGPYETPFWAGGLNNWGAVCAGAIGAAFLHEERDPARLRRAIVSVIGTLEAYIGNFPADGACEEGPSYWAYGFGYFALFAQLLCDYTGGAVDLFKTDAATRISAFQQRIRLDARRVASFADGTRFADVSGWLPAVLHAHYPALPAGDGSLERESAANLLFGPLLRGFLYCDPASRDAGPADAVEHFPDTQWLVVRRAPFAFAAQFGDNGVSHNHNDVGSFLLVDGGREGPMDLGSGLYTRQYFGAERYGDAIFCCGSQGHGVPLVGGAVQRDGSAFRAAEVRLKRTPCDAEIVFSGDIAPAYGLPALRSLRRSFRIRPADGAVEIRDAFLHDGGLPASTERFVGYEKPVIEAPGQARFGVFAVRFDPALAATVRDFPFPTRDGEKTAHALDIALPAGTTCFAIDFKRLPSSSLP